MLLDVAKAKIVITNYHAFKRRETMDLSKVGRALLQGRGEAPETIETEGQMLQRACGELIALKNVVAINDEAHHCYREKPDADEEEDLKGEEKDEAKKNNEAARLWINGLEALEAQGWCSGSLRPFGHAVLSSGIGLRRGHPVSLDCQ
jgi:type III restriction enzyme